MADGPPGGQPRCLRAPRGEQDFLGGEQVDRYLTLLRPADLKALTSADFAARANRACLARGGSERRLGGPKLAEAVLESLEEGPVSVREALALELDAPAALRQALAAYSAGRVRRVSSAGLMGAVGSAGGIATYELPAFVRFCVAYRIHCYLETSLVPQLHPGAVCEKGNLQPEVVFVLGGPGAGKSTQCARIAQVFGHCHLSVAELLREEHSLAGPGSAVELSSLAWEAPAEHIVELLQRAMKDGGWLGKSYVVEGFPRRTADLDVWDRLLGNQIRVTCGLFFAAPESVLAARLRARGASTEAVKRWASESWGEPLGLLERLAARGLLQRVAAEAGVEEVWRGIQGILGPRVVFVLGCPGAGKGTQCARISEAFGYKHLSAGDLLREECRRDPEIEAQVREGKLVSSKTVVALLRRKMEEQGWQGRRYIIDGFPRSLANLEEWNASIKGRASVKLCLHFDCSQAIANARLLDFAKTSGRADDNPEAIGKRFSTWYHGSQPVLQAFKEEGLLRRVDAERSLEAVWGDVQELFGPSVIFALGGPGAGKGTQCTRISETFGYQHLSTGDLLRVERSQSSSPLKALIEEPLSAGRLVPTEVVVRLVQRAMEERGWEGGKYLIDGFPRSFDNWQAWNCIIGQKVSVKHALFFDCSEAIMEARLLSKEDKQSDDTQEAIQQRLEVFRNESVPVVQRFETKGLLRRIDASRTKEEVWSDVKKLFGPSVIFVLGAPNVGKRTLCNRIAETFGYHHVRVEDLEEDWQEGRDGLAGVSAAETKVALLQRAMEERGWEGGRYVVDGFPHSRESLEAWERSLQPRVSLKLALLFDLGDEASPGECSLPLSRDLNLSAVTISSQEEQLLAFNSESPPVIRRFEDQGLLRKVCVDQDVEAVWSCVQEVLRFELEAQLQNHAVVLVKQQASNAETDRFVQSFLASHNVAVLRTGTIPADKVLSSGLFDRAFSQLMGYASGDPRSIALSAGGKARFREAAGLDWAEALDKGFLLSAAAALPALGHTASSLRRLWDGGGVAVWRLDQYLSVAWITGENGSGAWVINGFALQWRANFVEAAARGGGRVRWFWVEFSPSRVPWKSFLKDLLGNLNPKEASPDSIRGQFYQHWRMLGLQEPPDILDNCVHASQGPLEALRDFLLWTGGALEEHPLARSLMSGGVPRETLEAWLENPLVEDWRVGQDVFHGPLFASTEGYDHAAFRTSALRHVRLSGGGLCPWPLRAKRATTASPGARTVSKAKGKNKLEAMTLLHFNDVYNVEPRGKEPVGGIARFVTRMRELKAEAVARGEEPLCLFSGDAFNPSLTSTVTKGWHMVPALNAVGIDMACYGNHDFDFGVDELADMASENNFPWLISNVVDKTTGEGLANGRVTHMMDWYGRKIGLMGLVEREWLVTLHTIEPEDVVYEDFCQCATRLGRQLREEGAELVLALTHMRVPNDELLAQEVAEIDIILGGHDHHYDVKPVGPHGTYVLKSGTDFRDVTVLRLRFTDGSGPKAFEVLETQHVEINSAIAEDPEMKQLTEECKQKVGSAMDEVLGQSAVDLDCRFSSIRTRETNVGNFVTDVMRTGLKADMAMINSGTLRADAIVEKGPIKVRDLLSILPMLDELCLLELTGAQVLSVLQNSVSQYPRLEGRFLQVSGVTFSFDAAKPGGERLDEGSACIGGEPIEATRRYRVCTLNYLRQGKDGFDALKGAMCLADGEQAGILPTLVREHLMSISTLNGTTEKAAAYRVKRATKCVTMTQLSRIGEGPSPLQQLAIRPEVEGRIKCINGVEES